MTPEGKIKAYLFQRVREEGGMARNAQWIGRPHCPDSRIMLPWICAWVETKRVGKLARAGQEREHKRMRKYGEIVVVLNSKKAVDKWIAQTGYFYLKDKPGFFVVKI